MVWCRTIEVCRMIFFASKCIGWHVYFKYTWSIHEVYFDFSRFLKIHYRTLRQERRQNNHKDESSSLQNGVWTPSYSRWARDNPSQFFFEKGLVITPVFVGQPLDRPPRIARDEMVWTEDFPNPMCGITSAQLHRLIRRIMRSFSAYFELMTTLDYKLGMRHTYRDFVPHHQLGYNNNIG